jgi:hypothetical protein
VLAGCGCDGRTKITATSHSVTTPRRSIISHYLPPSVTHRATAAAVILCTVLNVILYTLTRTNVRVCFQVTWQKTRMADVGQVEEGVRNESWAGQRAVAANGLRAPAVP